MKLKRLTLLITITLLAGCSSNRNEQERLFVGQGNLIDLQVNLIDSTINERFIIDIIKDTTINDTVFTTVEFQNEQEGFFDGYLINNDSYIELGLQIKKSPYQDTTKYKKGVYHLTFSYLNPDKKLTGAVFGVDDCDMVDLCNE